VNEAAAAATARRRRPFEAVAHSEYIASLINDFVFIFNHRRNPAKQFVRQLPCEEVFAKTCLTIKGVLPNSFCFVMWRVLRNRYLAPIVCARGSISRIDVVIDTIRLLLPVRWPHPRLSKTGWSGLPACLPAAATAADLSGGFGHKLTKDFEVAVHFFTVVNLIDKCRS
jgi:hypothetical protein